MRTPFLAALAVAAAASVSIGATAPDDPSAEAQVDPALAGRHTYEIYCSNCHGDEALGDGPLADLLRILTPDLTRLSERNGGEFPAEHVRSRIDGTEDVQAHGRRMMPVWGQKLRSDRAGTSGDRIPEIIAYLESIQESD